jgi:hypothetical protein
VPEDTGTLVSSDTLRPRTLLYPVMPKAAAVRAVLITDIEATPDCVASRSLLPRSWPTEPTMVAPMATALIGVQASQPVLATRPALLGSDA